MAKTARVILNPTSGGGRGGKRIEAIRRGLAARGIDATLLLTAEPRHAVSLAREAAHDGVDLVVAAGGDGTVHETASGLLQALAEGADDVALGVLPVGTGNDFAKLVGPLKDLDGSLDVLARGRVRRFDAGLAGWGDGEHWFVNAGGTGVDVEVVRQILRNRSGHTPALLKYLSAVLKALVGFEAVPLRIRLDSHEIETEAMIIAVSNGRCVGGGFWVTPDAEPDDGVFDVCLVKRTSYLEALGALPLIIRGRHQNHPRVEMHRARVVEIVALGEDPLFFQLDGELHEPERARRLTFRVVPAALPVVTDDSGGLRP